MGGMKIVDKAHPFPYVWAMPQPFARHNFVEYIARFVQTSSQNLCRTT
jgi:hypothetical protein